MNNISAIISRIKSDKYIPDILSEYLKRVLDKNMETSLIRSLEWNYIKTLDAISKMFEMASEFTDELPDSLMKHTGFKSSDLTTERLDTSFAEIRTINYLGINGFKKIEIIHDKTKKYADIIAIRENKLICFEVTCITNSGSAKWTRETLVKYINYRLNEKGKIIQLKNTRDDYCCEYMCLVNVIVNDAGIALNNNEDYIAILKELHELNQNDKLIFSIITGKIDAFTGIPDDCIYPNVF